MKDYKDFMRRRSLRVSSDKFLDKIKKDFPKGIALTDLQSINKTDNNNNKLQDNIFEQIITAEMELAMEFNHKKLSSLVKLYNSAIQYYSKNDPSKVKAYRQRMEHFLKKGDKVKNVSKYSTENKIANLIDYNPYIGTQYTRKKRYHKLVKDINFNEIREQVKLVLRDVIILVKYDKKNLRNIIKKEMKEQREKWLERLYNKKNYNSRFVFRRRKTFTAKGDGKKLSFMKFLKKEKKNLIVDDESSEEFDENKYQNDEDFLKLLNEMDGRKNLKDNSDSNSDSEQSIIGDDYQENDEEDDEDTEEEYEEEYEEDEEDEYDEENETIQNNYETENDFNKAKNIDVINQIDENKDKQNNNENNFDIKKDFNYIKKNSLEKEDIQKSKTHHSKYLSKYTISPDDKKDEKETKILPKEENSKSEKKDNVEKKDIKEEEDSLKNKIINENKDDIPEKTPATRKKSIDDENVIREIKLDDEIIKTIEEKMGKIYRLLDGTISDDDSNLLSSTSLPSVTPIKKLNIEKMPLKFKRTFRVIEQKLKKYADNINSHFYLEMFDNFFYKLKELYDNKYKKYIEVNDEYHSSIKGKEFIIESNDNLDINEKNNLQNIIDGLKEEEKDQIDKILDEYNTNIKLLINEFKQNLFKNNVGIQLIEEQLKLDIITIINEAFY